MFTIKKGSTRIVLLTKRHALKFPSMYDWKQFCLGMVDNMTEWEWRRVAKNPDSHICPPLWCSPLGLLLVMPRCSPIKNVGLYHVELKRICSLSPTTTTIAPEFYLDDANPSNYGYYKGRMVKLDFAGGR